MKIRQKREGKFCSLCFKDIDESKNYSVFKYNQLFKVNSPTDVWHCMFKHYICKSCLIKLQKYCQEGMFAEESKEE